MALTYRSPVEEVLTLLEPTAQSLIASTATQCYQNSEKENFAWFNFSLPAIAKEHLSKAGIYLSPYSGYPHSHPVCKTLENYILYKVLPGIINNTFYFVGIKDFKLNFLKKRHKNLDLIKAVNRYVSSADKIRYGNEFVVCGGPDLRAMNRHQSDLERPTLSSLVPNVKTGSNLFLHDELHYWSKSELIAFLEIVEPKTMLGTVVYPTEIFAGARSSLNPWCYEFEIKGDKLIFYPDGVRAEAYEQPLYGGYLLQANKIRLPSGKIYCVDVIASKFTHHLVAITAGDAVVPTNRSFGPFEAVCSGELQKIGSGKTRFYPVSHSVLLRIYRYLRSLKKPDMQSAMAKFSQLCNEPSGAAISFMEEFSHLVIHTGGIRTVLAPESIKSFFGNLSLALPGPLAAKINSARAVSLDLFISTLKPLSVDLKLVQLEEYLSLPNFDFDSTLVENDADVVEQMESWAGTATSRVSQPYVGMVDLVYRRHKWELDFNKEAFLKGFADFYYVATTCAGGKPSMSISQFVALVYPHVALLGRVCLSTLGASDLESISQYCEYLKLPKIELEEGLTWFLAHKKCRRPTMYLESKNWHDYTGMHESETFKPVKPRWQFIPYNSEEELFKSELEPVPAHESQIPMAQERPAPEMPSASKSRANLIECSCGTSITVYDLPFASFHGLEFVDQLSTRKASWYSKESQPYKYNGGCHESLGWPEWLSAWCDINEIDGKYNCLLAQEYQQGGKIGFHSDDEAIFETGESIYTVNVEGEADFGFKCNGETWFHLQKAQGFEMPKGWQETHKHAVKQCSKGRISMTFRVLKRACNSPEAATPEEQEHDIESDSGHNPQDHEEVSYTEGNVKITTKPMPENLKFNVIPNSGRGDCFWHALSYFTGATVEAMKSGVLQNSLIAKTSRLVQQLEPHIWAEDEAICAACTHFNVNITILDFGQKSVLRYTVEDPLDGVQIKLENSHFEALQPVSACSLIAISELLQRSLVEITKAAIRNMGAAFEEELFKGKGVDLPTFTRLLQIFGIRGFLVKENETVEVNAEGTIPGKFKIEGDHISLILDRGKPRHKQTRVEQPNLAVGAEQLLKFKEMCSETKYTPDPQRGMLLAQSLKEGRTGVLCSELYNDVDSLYPASPQEGSVNLMLLLGTFGSGKSRCVKKLLEQIPGKSALYVSPRKSLCQAFEKDLKGMRDKIGKVGTKHFTSATFEKALLQMEHVIPGTLVLIDEVQLYPPGYIDLLLLKRGHDLKFVLLGDPCQSDYDSEKDRVLFGAMKADIEIILDGCEYKYNVESHRFTEQLYLNRLPCSHSAGSFTASKGLKLKLIEGLESLESLTDLRDVCLVSSFEEKKIVNAYFGASCACYTFGESTGMTFKNGSVLITGVSAHTNEKRWLTALSRFRNGIALVNATGSSWNILARSYANRVLGRFLDARAAISDLKDMLPGKPKFEHGFCMNTYGADEGKREEKLGGDPWLKTMVNLFQREDMEEIEMLREVLDDEWCKTHLPQCELEGVRARWVHKILAKERREKRMGYLVSEQFTDEHSKQKGAQLTNAAERFECIYPRHRASDTVTFIMAVRKRLRFSDPMRENAKLMQAMPYGPYLLKEFLKRIPLKPMHNVRLMEEAKFDFEEKKCSKSKATIENHSNRSCKDWLMDVGLVFSKSQLCTKFDNRFRDAKAAQTIVCFQHSVLCRFAPYMRYIEKKLMEVLPRQYYIHSGKGLDELNAWVKEGKFEGVCTESDYEAFDASQDQYIVAFEVNVMRYLGIPNDVINDYVFIKTHLGSKLGNFSIMRFSGEASTFLFNTMANMLFTFLRYSIKGNEYICFAGDDMCANTRLHISKEHESFLGKLKLKAKVDNTNHPTFCGWNLSAHGIFKKPQLVFERLCIAKETNNLGNCIDNYAIEVSFAYKMGELAIQQMNEEEVDAFYNCVRVIIKYKHLLKSDVVNVFSSGLM
ncbi:replicase [Ligustrum necrotic ringspot virus]|uniref:ORF1 protein n=1 Tax=Ligustrum necrotic ringspot virus TaxID=478550 RepID=B0LFB7_9VIRU|nr:replicase [Ligustrum necrotic ringspot virus]ABW69734.1 replicase [Ligustrum necrotic ringspot virus]